MKAIRDCVPADSDMCAGSQWVLKCLRQQPLSLQASVTCATTGPIVIKDPKKIRGTSGEDVFSEKKGLGFLKNKVCRASVFLPDEAKSSTFTIKTIVTLDLHGMSSQDNVSGLHATKGFASDRVLTRKCIAGRDLL